jgi:Arc/MetJ-type ribon-helix-helix transcriptional regulator
VTTITCKIPQALDATLEAVAKHEGISKSAVVRYALSATLEAKKAKLRLSAHDVMKAGCGIIKGGPRDRSWNPKRMEGFGRD